MDLVLGFTLSEILGRKVNVYVNENYDVLNLYFLRYFFWIQR